MHIPTLSNVTPGSSMMLRVPNKSHPLHVCDFRSLCQTILPILEEPSFSTPMPECNCPTFCLVSKLVSISTRPNEDYFMCPEEVDPGIFFSYQRNFFQGTCGTKPA